MTLACRATRIFKPCRIGGLRQNGWLKRACSPLAGTLLGLACYYRCTTTPASATIPSSTSVRYRWNGIPRRLDRICSSYTEAKAAIPCSRNWQRNWQRGSRYRACFCGTPCWACCCSHLPAGARSPRSFSYGNAAGADGPDCACRRHMAPSPCSAMARPSLLLVCLPNPSVSCASVGWRAVAGFRPRPTCCVRGCYIPCRPSPMAAPARTACFLCFRKANAACRSRGAIQQAGLRIPITSYCLTPNQKPHWVNGGCRACYPRKRLSRSAFMPVATCCAYMQIYDLVISRPATEYRTRSFRRGNRVGLHITAEAARRQSWSATPLPSNLSDPAPRMAASPHGHAGIWLYERTTRHLNCTVAVHFHPGV